MKIHILNNIEDCIDGYTPVLLENGKINIDCPDNSISSILMIDSIEQIPYEEIDTILLQVRKLIRINGTLVIGGIDINCISRDLINRSINTKIYNEIIFNKKSIHDSKELSDKLSSLGFKIDKITLKGALYELHASRPN